MGSGFHGKNISDTLDDTYQPLVGAKNIVEEVDIILTNTVLNEFLNLSEHQFDLFSKIHPPKSLTANFFAKELPATTAKGVAEDHLAEDHLLNDFPTSVL